MRFTYESRFWSSNYTTIAVTTPLTLSILPATWIPNFIRCSLLLRPCPFLRRLSGNHCNRDIEFWRQIFLVRKGVNANGMIHSGRFWIFRNRVVRSCRVQCFRALRSFVRAILFEGAISSNQTSSKEQYPSSSLYTVIHCTTLHKCTHLPQQILWCDPSHDKRNSQGALSTMSSWA